MVRGPRILAVLSLSRTKVEPFVDGSYSILTVLRQQAYQRLQIQQQMLQAQRNVSGPMRQQEQQVGIARGV